MATAQTVTNSQDSPNDLVGGDMPWVAPGTSASDREKATYVYRRWKLQSDHYTGYLRQWAEAVFFLLGKQWYRWNATTRQYSPERNIPKWRQQPVTNLCFALYRTAIAKLTTKAPAFDCVPPSGDSDDRDAAQLSGALLKYWWRALKMPAFLKRTLGWLLCTGNAYVLVYWDPQVGKSIPLRTSHIADDGTQTENVPADENGDPYLRQDGTPDLDASPHIVQEGEVALATIPAWFVRFNPEAESPDDADEWYIADIKHVKTAATLFDLEESTVTGGVDDDLLATIDSLQAASSNASNAMATLGVLSGTDNSVAKGTRCLVLRYYKKPNAEFPKGRHWITVNDVMAKPEAELPNGFWPPCVTLQDVTPPGQTLAMGLLPQVVGLNKQYNVLNGRVMEHNETMARGGKWVVSPEDLGLNITSDPAQVLASKGYAAGRPPIQTNLKGLPPEVLAERERIISDFQLVSGISDAGYGQKPEGVTSGRGFLALQEQSDAVLMPTMMVAESALEEVGRRQLIIAREKYREDRTIRIRGEDGKWQFQSFQAADLGDSIDVQVQVGSSFPWNKSARQDLVLTTLQAFPGLVTNPQTGEVNKQQLATYLDTGGVQAFESENDPDADEIDREHAMFEAITPQDPQGAPVPEFWQDHAKHYVGHCDFMKRDFGRFLRWSPQAQQAFLVHINDTRDAIAEAMQQMLPPSATGVGGPQAGGPPAPGGPGGAPPSPLGLTTNAPSSPAGSATAGTPPQLTPQDFAAAAAAA